MLGELVASGRESPETYGPRSRGGFWIFLPETGFYAADQTLRELSRQVADTVFEVTGERLRVTPVIGYTTFGDATSAREIFGQASMALHDTGRSPRPCAREVRERSPLPAPGQPAYGQPDADNREVLVSSTGRVLPFGVAGRALHRLCAVVACGIRPEHCHLALIGGGHGGRRDCPWIACFRITARSVESLATVPPVAGSLEPETGTPLATAIVVAFLASESATIVDTVTALLDHDYPGELQVILAYNAPDELPVEDDLKELVAQDPRLMCLRVDECASKAECIRAALPHVRGEFVGIFDADNHLEQGSFSCAWRWLTNGYDIVQGHRVVRNGGVSWVTRLVAVDYEATQGLSDPGRTGLNGFGVFGGSNTYWRTDAVCKIGPQPLIEPKSIDSSLGRSQDTFVTVSDPLLLSSELAPTTLRALWTQRMRWAKERVSARQRVGQARSESGWMQTIPWLSLQVLPIVGFVVWRDGGFGKLYQLTLLFAALAFFVVSLGAAQAGCAYLLGNPRIKRHRPWFVLFAFHSAVWFSEFKDLIGRIAPYKGAIGEQQPVTASPSSEMYSSSGTSISHTSVTPARAAGGEVLPPEQTHLALVDWSYDLLSEHERDVLCRLSVFSGGWNLAAAEAVVVKDRTDVLEIADVLGSLVDKRIVLTDQTEFGLRYELPESIRQFAAETLAESRDEELEIRSAHAWFFVKFAEKSEQEFRGSPQAEWLDRLEVEHDNLLAAIATFLADPSTRSVALRIIMPLSGSSRHGIHGNGWTRLRLL